MNDAASQRALRKQLLLVRSAAERAELVQTLAAVRRSITVFGKAAPGLAMGLPLVLGLLRQTSMLSPLLSLVLARARRPAIRYGALAAGAALLAWKGWQWLAAAQRAPAPVPADAVPQGHAVAPE